jgi:hypothetical protein
VHLKLKTGSELTASIDSISWWGVRFKDKRSVMYKQLEYMDVYSQKLIKRIISYVPDAEAIQIENRYRITFEGIRNNKPLDQKSRIIGHSYVLLNIKTEKAEQGELQLNFTLTDAPFLIVQIGSSIGVSFDSPADYESPPDYELSDESIKTIIFAYSFGLGYRHYHKNSELSLIPIFANKIVAQSQDGVLLNQIDKGKDLSDVAFAISTNYRHYIFNESIILSLGSRLYLDNIPIQNEISTFSFNLGIGFLLNPRTY